MVLLQAQEHGLRSYRPFQCWLLLTVLSKNTASRSLLIDVIRFKTKIGETVGVVTRAASILKVVESQEILEKLVIEFNCKTLNVILAQKPVET